MKKLLLISLFIVNYSLLIVPKAFAVKLCKQEKPCDWLNSHPWNNDDSMPDETTDYICNPACESESNSANATWTVTITNGLGRSGTISGQSRCSANGTTNPPVADTSDNGYYCWCRVTNIVDSTVGKTCAAGSNDAPWVLHFLYANPNAEMCRAGCAYDCVYAIRYGFSYMCHRDALLNISPIASEVTCPLNGTCTYPGSGYKTVADNASCGTGYIETTAPRLYISGSFSDAKGSYGYNCHAN
jgi:hypothetical protein